jgi:hypothetical protein
MRLRCGNEVTRACDNTHANSGLVRPACFLRRGGRLLSKNTIATVWQSVRLGLDGSVFIGDRFAFSAEAVWLPYVILNGVDDHLLRADLGGGIREDGTGHGYQLEALLSYKVTPFSSVGLGGRYWHMESNGNTHFEVVGGLPQPVNWKSDIFGVFLQGSIQFGVYPDGDLGPTHSNF